MGKKDELLTGAVRRSALTRLTREERMKYELARELGLLDRVREEPYAVGDACTACGVCTTLGCPAIAKDPETGRASIDAGLCIGCGQCAQYCAFGAILGPTVLTNGGTADAAASPSTQSIPDTGENLADFGGPASKKGGAHE